MAKLTAKQQRFCEEYLIDLNATQAAIRAGYSAKTAKQIGGENLTKPDVKRHIMTLKGKRSEKTGIDAAWVLSRLAEDLEADLADLYDDRGRLKPVMEWPLIWRQGLVSGVDVQQIASMDANGDPVPAEIVKVKLSDRVQRLKLAGDHVDVQAFKQQLEVKHKHSLEDRLEAAMAKRAEYARTLGGESVH